MRCKGWRLAQDCSATQTNTWSLDPSVACGSTPSCTHKATEARLCHTQPQCPPTKHAPHPATMPRARLLAATTMLAQAPRLNDNNPTCPQNGETCNIYINYVDTDTYRQTPRGREGGRGLAAGQQAANQTTPQGIRVSAQQPTQQQNNPKGKPKKPQTQNGSHRASDAAVRSSYSRKVFAVLQEIRYAIKSTNSRCSRCDDACCGMLYVMCCACCHHTNKPASTQHSTPQPLLALALVIRFFFF